MKFNIWIVIVGALFLYTTCWCVKKEYFENNDTPTIYKKESEQKGTTYTLVDVNKGVQLILQHFNNDVTVTKILNIMKIPNEIHIRLFLYHQTKNFIKGYTAIISTPLNKKFEIKTITEFSSDDQMDIKNIKIDNFNKIDLNNGFLL